VLEELDEMTYNEMERVFDVEVRGYNKKSYGANYQ
jgi:hypothetical protein